MSTNDDSASRRVRRPEQADRRGPVRQERDDRWDQSSSRERADPDFYLDPSPREAQPRGGYSNFSRNTYQSQQEPAQPYPLSSDPAPRNNTGRREPQPPAYTPPSPPYEPEPLNLGFRDSDRDDLFAHDTDPDFGPGSYGLQGGYQSDPYEQKRAQPTLSQQTARRDETPYIPRETIPPAADDYDRSFQSRAVQDPQAARFYLPDDEPQKPRPAQPARSFTPPQPPGQPQFAANTYAPEDPYDAHFDESWADEHEFHDHELHDHALHDDAPHAPHHELAHGNELDEDFFADEDELETDPVPPRKSNRKWFMAAALAGAMVVGGGGAYLYKSLSGGDAAESATPYIRADNRPLKELPGNPGGKQFPNGEKAIYDRLTPDGQQVQASAYTPPAAAAPASQPPAGNSLEERIDEALKKAQQANDAPPQQAAPVQSASVDQPTVVRSESYRPDGSRVEAPRSMVMPSMADNGQLPPPFGTTAQTPAAPAQPLATPFRTTPVPSSPQLATATPAPRAAAPATGSSGYWVSLKSAPDERAIQRDLTILTDKYKSVLGDVPLTSKIADLGAKGVHYRAVAGPLNSRQEALDLCQRIKGIGGDRACFVTN